MPNIFHKKQEWCGTVHFETTVHHGYSDWDRYTCVCARGEDHLFLLLPITGAYPVFLNSCVLFIGPSVEAVFKAVLSLTLRKHFIRRCCQCLQQAEQRWAHETGDRLLLESRHTDTPSATQICLSSVSHKTAAHSHAHTRTQAFSQPLSQVPLSGTIY